MTARSDQIDAFLRHAGWQDAQRVLLAGDASNRRYERLTLGSDRAVLMDAPSDKGEDVRPFVSITQYLRAASLSAPRILAKDPQTGFLLLEDLGDALFARVVAKNPEQETELYLAAIDALHALHMASAPQDVAAYAPDMGSLSALAAKWYGDGSGAAELAAETDRLAAKLDDRAQVLALRDFHAENLIWLPDRSGAQRVGLLDYQDARLSHPAYDIASLLRDARRDVSADVQEASIAHYVSLSGMNRADFDRAYAICSAQRNLRILGVFARLSLHFGKPGYIDLIPRVWNNLKMDFAHPDLGRLRELALTNLPAPEAAHLASLKERCGTCPSL